MKELVGGALQRTGQRSGRGGHPGAGEHHAEHAAGGEHRPPGWPSSSVRRGDGSGSQELSEGGILAGQFGGGGRCRRSRDQLGELGGCRDLPDELGLVRTASGS